MSDLDYTAVIPTLFSAVPEAKRAYDAWDMPGEPLPYIVFSFLEESFLRPLVRSEEKPELLRRIFAFLEQMAASRDEQVGNLLWVGLFEAWIADPLTNEHALKYMQPRTKAQFLKAARRNNIPL